MEENNAQLMTKKERFSNFWYYHKWHTIVALFLVIVFSVCCFQMCSKTSYDIHIMYAGPYEFKRTSKNGDLPPYANAQSSLKEFANDYNGDGELNVNFLDLYLLTSAEIQEAEKEEGTEVTYSLLNNNKETFLNNLVYSEYYVCLISTSLYDINKTMHDTEVFTPLEKYMEGTTPYIIDGKIKTKEPTSESFAENECIRFYDERAIYLSSTALYSLPEFSSMPSDTLITLRIKSAVASHFDKEETNLIYQNSEDYIRSLLNEN